MEFAMPLSDVIDPIRKIDGLSWYLIRTMPRCEKRAGLFFRQNGIPYYLPEYNRNYINSFTGKNGRQYAYKRPSVQVPMFPGYIFAALDLTTIGDSRRSRNIIQVCMYANYTEDELIRDLNKVKEFEILAKNNQIEVNANLKPGDHVAVIRGPFQGWDGVIERRADKNLLWVNVNTIGYAMSIEIAAADCEEWK